MVRDPLLPGVEVLHAHFIEYRYAPHWHEAVCVALVGRGAAAFECGKDEHLAPAGSVFVIPAFQVHTGEPAAPDGLDYRVLYVTPERMTSLLDGAPANLSVRSTRDVVHRRTGASGPLAWFHRCITDGALPLEREHALLASVTAVAKEFGRLGDQPTPAPEHRAVRRARDYLDAHAAEPVTLQQLTQIAGLSMHRLARTFRAQVGMPPHAYQVQLRVLQAKRLLAAGMSIGQAAATCGFFDQAHLTHHFRRYVGVTPGTYLRAAA